MADWLDPLVPKLIQKSFLTREQQFVQHCETKVGADACKASYSISFGFFLKFLMTNRYQLTIKKHFLGITKQQTNNFLYMRGSSQSATFHSLVTGKFCTMK